MNDVSNVKDTNLNRGERIIDTGTLSHFKYQTPALTATHVLVVSIVM